MCIQYQVNKILDYLNETQIKATYGAVADAVGVKPYQVGGFNQHKQSPWAGRGCRAAPCRGTT